MLNEYPKRPCCFDSSLRNKVKIESDEKFKNPSDYFFLIDNDGSEMRSIAKSKDAYAKRARTQGKTTRATIDHDN